HGLDRGTAVRGLVHAPSWQVVLALEELVRGRVALLAPCAFGSPPGPSRERHLGCLARRRRRWHGGPTRRAWCRIEEGTADVRARGARGRFRDDSRARRDPASGRGG